MIKKSKHITFIYLTLLTIGTLWTFLMPDGYRNYGPAIFGISTFTVFGLNYIIQFLDFKFQLKKWVPSLYKEYSNGIKIFGIEKLSNSILFNEKDKIENSFSETLRHSFKMSKLNFTFLIYSFLSLLLLTLLQVFINHWI